MLHSSNEQATTISSPNIARHSAQKATRVQQYGRAELLISTFYVPFNRPEKFL